MAAFRHLALKGEYLGGFVAAFSKENRRNIVLLKHDHEQDEMRQRLFAQIKLETSRVRASFDRQFSRARESFLGKCDVLKSSQDQSWAEIRAAWRDYNTERSAAFGKAQTRQGQINRDLSQGRGRGRAPQ